MIVVNLATQIAKVFQLTEGERVIKFKVTFNGVPVFGFLAFTQRREKLFDKIFVVVQGDLYIFLGALKLFLHVVNPCELRQHLHIFRMGFSKKLLVEIFSFLIEIFGLVIFFELVVHIPRKGKDGGSLDAVFSSGLFPPNGLRLRQCSEGLIILLFGQVQYGNIFEYVSILRVVFSKTLPHNVPRLQHDFLDIVFVVALIEFDEGQLCQ